MTVPESVPDGVRVHRTRADAAAQLAEDVVELLAAQLHAGNHPRIVLTGGSVAREVHRDLAPRSQGLEWARVTVLWGDERFVEAGSEDRNDQQAVEDLLAHVPILPAGVHRMPSPEDVGDVHQAATSYAASVRTLLADDSHEAPAFDLVMLGIGDDGHVASLFPDRPPPAASVIGVEDSPKPPPQRVSMGYDLVNRARRVWFVAAGEDKAEAVRASVLREPADLPAARVRGMEDTRWYLDEAAAALL